jgi:hypothetical protein
VVLILGMSQSRHQRRDDITFVCVSHALDSVQRDNYEKNAMDVQMATSMLFMRT